MSLGMPDAVSFVLASALDGLATRQSVIADNIANVDTPGFRATSVDFEASLTAALQRGEMSAAGVTPTTRPTTAPVGEDGNPGGDLVDRDRRGVSVAERLPRLP